MAIGRIRRFLDRVHRRTWIILGAVAVAAVVGGGVTASVLSQLSSAQAAPITQTVAASLETFDKSVEATGTLTPSVQEDVNFAASGTVTAVSVSAGDTVSVGQALATVDSLTVNAELLQAQADLADTQAQLASEQENADGTTASQSRVAAQEAAIVLAEQSVATAQSNAAHTTLTAPVAGLVTSVSLSVGDVVSGTFSSSSSSGSGSASSASASGGSGASAAGGASSGGNSSSTSSSAASSTAQFSIVGTDAWTVSVSVGETEVGLVAAGDQVELVTDNDAQLFGTVDEVGLLPATTSGTAAFPVDISITGTPEGLFDGTSVTATIIYERRSEVLAVQSSAVTTDADGASTVTLVDTDGNETEQGVTIGETSGDLTEITAGLSEGDLVLVTIFTPQAGNSMDGTQQGGMGQQGGTDQQGGFPGGGEMPSGDFPSGGFPGGGQQ